MNFRKNNMEKISKNKEFLLIKNALGLHCDNSKI